MKATDAILSVTSLRKRFAAVEVLKGIDLTVTPGAIHGLVGLNGSGKTTTMECVLGMQSFQSGNIQILGRQPADIWRCQGAVVGIFDTPGIHSGLTVRQVLTHARMLCPQPVHSPAEVEDMLGLGRYSHYRIRQLSLGNRRRVSIAHALLGQPRFIIMDEPFNGLDAGGVDDVLNLIKDLNSRTGASFLLSSHQLAYLESICTHISILHNGRIALTETLQNLTDSTDTHLRIVCDSAGAAIELLQTDPAIQVSSHEQNLLNVQTVGIDAAEINRRLVMAGISVSELQPIRRGLHQVFQDIVNAPSDTSLQEAS
ncbi:ABC transporter ATP-binding protein [Pseudohongiella sp. SYSU M77423]|uniref:ABC transporter ATP-binding protein n=1 Tax=Pseudohongiella sp. SYSU M77423 TaxID=3042312 RepID=UPI002480553B|nr:ABC transporter ATP-binding protein [Pseudohongiella sp. SYSU M77423]MDH7942252.1 ABC transporter ATP-binding protein [Pseudohongiella sp. SYSU M77423]MEC8859438.1 ABC transporter ATP-binding protein [Pseudomonadota bacterium]